MGQITADWNLDRTRANYERGYRWVFKDSLLQIFGKFNRCGISNRSNVYSKLKILETLENFQISLVVLEGVEIHLTPIIIIY